MAFTAVRTKVAIMYIVPVMAVQTKKIPLTIFIQRLYVAPMAMQPVVRSFYVKTGLVVIKFPNQPVVRVVTFLAFLPQCLLMNIVILVAIDTI